MHKLTEKLLATGAVSDQTLRLLKLWNSTFEQLPDEIKQAKTQEELLAIVDEMARMIEQEEEIPELRETEFDLEDTRRDPHYVEVEINTGGSQKLYVSCVLGKTVGGRYVYFVGSPNCGEIAYQVAVRGNILTDNGSKYMVTSVEPRYLDEQLKYYILTVEKMNADVSHR